MRDLRNEGAIHESDSYVKNRRCGVLGDEEAEMNFNLSSRRQNELLRQTIEYIEYCRSELSAIDQFFGERSGQLRHRIGSQQQEATQIARQHLDELESEWEQGQTAAHEALQTEVQLTKDELQDELETTKRHVKQQLSDGEYDWFLAKQRLVKEVEADKEAAQEAYKQERSKLKEHGDSFTALSDSAHHALKRHGCDLVIQGGDLLDPPDDSNHFAAHQQTVRQIQQLIEQFRKTFWVRFHEERWYLDRVAVGHGRAALAHLSGAKQPDDCRAGSYCDRCHGIHRQLGGQPTVRRGRSQSISGDFCQLAGHRQTTTARRPAPEQNVTRT